MMREMQFCAPLLRMLHHGDMDVAALRWFVTLCETENVRDTAAVHRTHPSSVSRSLARLEAEVGSELFTRHGRRLEVSRAGLLLRDHAERALEEWDTGLRRLDALGSPDLVRLGFLPSAGRRVVPRVLREHRERVPGTRFTLFQGGVPDLYARLAAGELDAAVVTRSAGAPVRWFPLAVQEVCLAVPAGHPLAGGGPVPVTAIAGRPFITFSQCTDLRRVIDALCAAAGVTPTIVLVSDEIDTVRRMVGSGLGVALLPRPEGAEADDPVYLPLRPALHRPIGLAVPDRGRPGPAAARFVADVTASAASPSPADVTASPTSPSPGAAPAPSSPAPPATPG